MNSDYIISPFIVYLFWLIDNFKSVLCGLAIILIVCIIFINLKNYWEKGKISLKILIFPIILIILNMFIPDKTTLVYIYSAKLATKQNIKDTSEFVRKYIIDVYKDIKEINMQDVIKPNDKKDNNGNKK